MADGGGKAAIVSAEGGIFDMLSGIYSKNVNIDVMLKGHSGDSIRVDRIGRNSESIMNPALTVLLTVQPNVLSGMMQNGTFRGIYEENDIEREFFTRLVKMGLHVKIESNRE